MYKVAILGDDHAAIRKCIARMHLWGFIPILDHEIYMLPEHPALTRWVYWCTLGGDQKKLYKHLSEKGWLVVRINSTVQFSYDEQDGMICSKDTIASFVKQMYALGVQLQW